MHITEVRLIIYNTRVTMVVIKFEATEIKQCAKEGLRPVSKDTYETLFRAALGYIPRTCYPNCNYRNPLKR